MILLVEGPDGTGKSTLIDELVKNHNFVKQTGVPRDWFEQYENWRDFYAHCFTYFKDIVVDRCFISELVYRIVKKDYEPNITLYAVIALLEQSNIKVIYCNTDNAYEFAKSRGESYVTSQDEFNEISTRYKHLFELLETFTEAKIYRYDWQFETVNDLVNKLKN
jgi:thymidylate kinase